LALDFKFQHIENLCCVARTYDVVKLILVDFGRLRSGTYVCILLLSFLQNISVSL